jgi:prevent-host-death family protein
LTGCQEQYYILGMKTFPVGEFKAHFSKIMERVRSGEEIIITYGKKKEKVAVVVPYAAYKAKRIQLGLLQDNILKIDDDFKMTEKIC